MRQVLNSFPRVSLLQGATPIQRLHSLPEALGSSVADVEIWVKRDDFMSLGGGGNKLRKLEFLLGDAIAQGCDTVVAIGGRQSNFARLAAATAAKCGLSCELVLASMVPIDSTLYNENGNVLLDRLFGARLHLLQQGADATAYADERVKALRVAGHNPYLAVLGGSTPVGCLGYVDCAAEIAAQEQELGFAFSHIVMANGSSGMHAGLAAGRSLLGISPSGVASYTVLSPEEPARQATLEKANATLRLLGHPANLLADDIVVSGSQLGDGYGLPTTQMRDAVELMASKEGLLLDPVYSGKAFAGLIADIRAGRFPAGSRLLFVMSGGAPGLFSYADTFN